MKISNERGLLASLKRLYQTDTTLVFRNDRGTKVVIRPVVEEERSDDPVMLTFELGLAVDDFFPTESTEFDGHVDETGVFVYQMLTVDLEDDGGLTDCIELLELLNDTAVHVGVCECGDQMIWDDGATCVLCQMHADPNETCDETCVLCSDRIVTARGLSRMPCCQQPTHRACARRWDSQGKGCAWCRTMFGMARPVPTGPTPVFTTDTAGVRAPTADAVVDTDDTTPLVED
jgi:hypothetical protein